MVSLPAECAENFPHDVLGVTTGEVEKVLEGMKGGGL